MEKGCCLITNYNTNSFFTSCGIHLLGWTLLMCLHHKQPLLTHYQPSVCSTCHCTRVWRLAITKLKSAIRYRHGTGAAGSMKTYDHLSKTCSVADKQPATCLHCSSQFVNQSVLEIHMQRCPSTEEEKNTGRGRGQGRGRCTGQVGTTKNHKWLFCFFF